MKPKVNRKGVTSKPSNYDSCQTPGWAVEPLFTYLDGKFIWEPACGRGNLVAAMRPFAYGITATDILNGEHQDFFTIDSRLFYWEVLVTNPPYSIKYDWLEHCYELGKPFALLMPVEMLGAQKAQKMFVKHGIELLFLPRRVNFDMPEKGYSGGGAQFPVAWYCWHLLDKPMQFWGVL